MNNGKYVSIKSILSEIIRYPFVDGIQEEDVALFLSRVLSFLGSPHAYDKKIIEVEIKDNRGLIPYDLVRIEGTRLKDDCGGYINLKYASDIYHSGIHCEGCPDLTCISDYTYSLNNNLIYTSFSTGTIQVAYQAIVTDENGFPMIPDLPEVIQALKYYILWQYAEPAYYRGQVPKHAYEDIQQKYSWYIGSASNKLTTMTMDQAKTLENGLIRLFQSVDNHADGWKSFASKEIYRK